MSLNRQNQGEEGGGEGRAKLEEMRGGGDDEESFEEGSQTIAELATPLYLSTSLLPSFGLGTNDGL